MLRTAQGVVAVLHPVALSPTGVAHAPSGHRTGWSINFETTPPDAPAREVLDTVYSMFDPIWFDELTQQQQLIVLRHHCKEEGWGRVWPEVAKRHRRGPGASPNRLTPSQRSQQAKMASYSSWARTWDEAGRTQTARHKFLSRFEREVDPEMKLPTQERARRAEQAKKAYFAALALKSSKARRRPLR